MWNKETRYCNGVKGGGELSGDAEEIILTMRWQQKLGKRISGGAYFTTLLPLNMSEILYNKKLNILQSPFYLF